MKILVLPMINSLCHRKCCVRVTFTRCLSQKPSIARTSLIRVFRQTNREYPSFYDVNYIYNKIHELHVLQLPIEMNEYAPRCFLALLLLKQ